MRTRARPLHAHISALVGPLHLPTPMTGLHATRLVASVGVLLPRHTRRRARVGGAPSDMVLHRGKLPHGASSPNCSRQLLPWPAGLSLLPDALPQQARPKAEARRGGVRAGRGGGADGGGGVFNDLPARFWAAAPFAFARFGGTSGDAPKLDQVAALELVSTALCALAGTRSRIVTHGHDPGSSLFLVVIIIVVILFFKGPLGGARVAGRRRWCCRHRQAVGAGEGGGKRRA